MVCLLSHNKHKCLPGTHLHLLGGCGTLQPLLKVLQLGFQLRLALCCLLLGLLCLCLESFQGSL
jgi:hypothetical protein